MLSQDFKMSLSEFFSESFGFSNLPEWVLKDWNVYFNKLNIPLSKQLQEFESIMRMRIFGDSISIVAPSLDDILR